MNGRIGILTLVLVLQLLVIGGLWLMRNNAADVTVNLLSFAPEAITRIEITEGTGDTATSALLERGSSGWTLAELPVDETRVRELLDKLASIDSPWPVATTSAARDRFEVSDDGYQKRVQLYAGDSEAATLLLGTSPGFKRIHARKPDEDNIYSIALTSLEVPVAQTDWLDKSLLSADIQVTGISRVGQWEAVQQAGSAPVDQPTPWSLRPLAQGATSTAADVTANATAIETLVGRFTGLQVIAAVDASTGPAVAAFELAGNQGQVLRYQLFEDTEQDRFSLSREDVAGEYEIAAYIAEQMRVSVSDLTLDTADATSTDSPDESSDTGSAEAQSASPDA